MSDSLPSLYAAARGLWTLTWRRVFSRKLLVQNTFLFLFYPVIIGYFSYFGRDESEAFFKGGIISIHVWLVVPISVLNYFGHMIRGELREDNFSYLFTRPVSRFRLYLLKYLTVMVALQIILFINGMVYWGVGAFLNIPELKHFIGTLLAVQFLEVIAYGALAGCLGLITRKYVFAGLIYGLIVEFGMGRIPTNINLLSINRHLNGFISQHTPIVEYFNLEVATREDLWISILVLPLGTAFVLGIGGLLFTYREYLHTSELQDSA